MAIIEQLEQDTTWLSTMLKKRHPTVPFLVWCRVQFPWIMIYVRNDSIDPCPLDINYRNFIDQLPKTTHANEVEEVMNRRMSLLLATEQRMGLKHHYQPSKEFEDFWIKTNGRTT